MLSFNQHEWIVWVHQFLSIPVQVQVNIQPFRYLNFFKKTHKTTQDHKILRSIISQRNLKDR